MDCCFVCLFVCLFLARQSQVAQDLLIHEVSRSHKDAPQSVELPWTSDQLVPETSTRQPHNTHNRQASMPTVEFEPTISAGEVPQTYALDCAATGTGSKEGLVYKL